VHYGNNEEMLSLDRLTGQDVSSSVEELFKFISFLVPPAAASFASAKGYIESFLLLLQLRVQANSG